MARLGDFHVCRIRWREGLMIRGRLICNQENQRHATVRRTRERVILVWTQRLLRGQRLMDLSTRTHTRAVDIHNASP